MERPDAQWLAGLTPGQPVAVFDDYPLDKRVRVAWVDRTTATQAIVDGERYYLKDGRQMGSGSWKVLLPLDHPTAVRAWQRRQFADADYAVHVAFKNAARLPMATVLQKAREAIAQAEAALALQSIPEPVREDTRPHDDPREETPCDA